MKSLKQAHQRSPFSVEVTDPYQGDDIFTPMGDGFDTAGDAVNSVLAGGDWGFKIYDCDHVLVCVGNTRT